MSASSSPISDKFSVFIPYVYRSVTEECIAHAFETNNLGLVDRVDFVRMVDSKGKSYKRAYVHFTNWFDNNVADNFKEKVIHSMKGTRLVYDDPWFWVILKNTSTKFVVESTNDSYDENDQNRSFVRHNKDGVAETYDLISDDYVSMLEFQLELAKKQIVDLNQEMDNWCKNVKNYVGDDFDTISFNNILFGLERPVDEVDEELF